MSSRNVKILLGCSLSSLLILFVVLLILLGAAIFLMESDDPATAADITEEESPHVDGQFLDVDDVDAPPPLVAVQLATTATPLPQPSSTHALLATSTIIPSPTRTPSPTITPRDGSGAEVASAATPDAPIEVDASSSSADVVITDATTCQAHTASQAYANVRKYPTLNSEVISYIEPGRIERVIAISHESDGTWYGIPSGWVFESVIDVTGSNCRGIPDASNVLWNQSLGHVDHQLRNYRLVSNIKIEEYMQKYPMLVFSNGTIWYNPNMQ